MLKRLSALIIAVIMLTGGLGSTSFADTGFGLSTPNSLSSADNKYGHVDVYRKFFQGMPKAMPNRSAVVSFKAQPRAIMGGLYDRYLRNWFRNLTNRATIYYSYWHEPQDFKTRAQRIGYKHAWQHIVRIERSTPTNGNLRSTYINHMNSAWEGEFGKWYPGDKWINVIGLDGKIKNWNKRYIPAKRHYADGVAFARKHNKPFGLAEYGATILPGYNGADRARWMRQTAHWLSNANAKFACWWDQNSTASGGPDAKAGDFRLNDRPSIKAMRWMLRGRWQ